MALSASGPADRVEQLIVLTESLTERLRAETAAYVGQRAHEVAAGVSETQRLANLYRHESTRVKADPALIAGAPEAARRRLLEATRAFEDTVTEHARAVAAAKTITEGLVQTIAAEVAGQRSPGGYGPGAKAAGLDTRSIALNKKA